MYKAADLIKKNIVRVDTGNIIGSVADLLFDPEKRQVVALFTSTGGWLRSALLVDWQAVLAWRGDVVLVQPGTEIIKASDNEIFNDLMDRKIHLAGTNVMTKSGVKLGSVNELLLHDSGEIGAYVLHSGFLGSERHYILPQDVVALGADALIVASDTLRDSLEDASAPAQPAKSGFRMPLTGSLVALPDETSTPAESEAPVEPIETTPEHIAETPEISLPADPDADLPPAMRVPTDEPTPEPETLPDLLREPTPVTGETIKLSPSEIDAVLRGDKPIPEVAPSVEQSEPAIPDIAPSLSKTDQAS